jgi:lipopolysaccharide export system protein LptC
MQGGAVDYENAPDTSPVALRVSRHTNRVRHLRLAVPALATGLFLTYALSATPPEVDRTFLQQFSSLQDESEGMKLARPRYAGEDLSGQPFEIAATSATRLKANEDLIGLERPEARRLGETGEDVRLTAEEGTYDQLRRVMSLSRSVELSQTGAGETFTLRTDAADIDVDEQVIETRSEIRGESEVGTLRADRGTLYQKDDRLVLEGGVKINLTPRKAADEAGSPARQGGDVDG